MASSSLTRDRTWSPALGAWSLSHWTPQGSPRYEFLTCIHLLVFEKFVFHISYKADLLATVSLNFIIFGCAGSSLLHGLCSSCGKWELLPIAMHGLLVAVASLVVEQRLQQLWHVGSGCCSQAPGHRLDSCGAPAELLHSMRDFPSQGSKPCLLHWQADSLPLSLQGSPLSLFFPEKVFFSLHFSMIIFWIQNSRLVVFLGFSFNTLNILHHSLLAHMVSEENFDVIFYPCFSVGNVLSPFGFSTFLFAFDFCSLNILYIDVGFF